IEAEEQGDKLSKEELRATITLLLIAGHETTVNLIGNGVLQLLRHRDQYERLGKDPSLAKTATDEVLRFDPPVLFTGRTAMADIELDGMTIKKGEHATVLIGAGNRDPEVFENPNVFDIGRTKNPHLAFGLGIHFCLGAPLARVEGQVALTTFAQRLPNMELEVDPPEYREHIVLRGIEALPVRF
ncbi:MAG: cytochrome P450, partial [Acidimicrobiia bacterium]